MTYYATGLFLHLSFARFFWLMLAVAGAAAIVTLREVAASEAPEPDAVETEGARRRVQRPINQSV